MIPGVSYLAVILPPTRTFRKNLNDLIRNLLAPFKIHEKKVKAQKKLIEDEETKKRLAEKVLKDLDEL